MFPLIARDIELRAISNRFLCYAIFISLVFLFLIFYFFPPFDFKPYELPYEVPIELVFPDEIIVPEAPLEVPQPAIPVEISEEEGAEECDIEIPSNVFASTTDMPIVSGAGDVPASEPEFYAFDQAPVLIESTKPVYPEVAREVGIEGTVLLRLLVDENGAVIAVDIIKSDVTATMEQNAIQAAMIYKFKPAKQRNVPVKAHEAVTLKFSRSEIWLAQFCASFSIAQSTPIMTVTKNHSPA